MRHGAHISCGQRCVKDVSTSTQELPCARLHAARSHVLSDMCMHVALITALNINTAPCHVFYTDVCAVMMCTCVHATCVAHILQCDHVQANCLLLTAYTVVNRAAELHVDGSMYCLRCGHDHDKS